MNSLILRVCVSVCLAATCLQGVAQGAVDSAEAALEAAARDERVADIRLDFPGIQFEPYYHDDYQVWIIELIHPESGEAGMISIDPRSGEVLEFAFNPNGFMDDDARDDAVDEEDDAGALTLANRFMPRFVGMSIVWLSLLISLLVLGDLKRPFSLINLDLLLIHALAPFLLLTWTHTYIAYTGLFALSAALLARCLWEALRPAGRAFATALTDARALALLLGFAALLHIITVYSRGIGDAGIWSAIGADYLWQTGQLPYGTEFGPNCIYGPLMYVLLLPANWLWPAGIEVAGPGAIAAPDYAGFAMAGVQSTVLLLDALTLWALYRLSRRSSGVSHSLAIALVYAISPYLLGVRSEIGLERASHVAGMPFILGAILLLKRPALAGALLGFAAGMLYYPAFLAPLLFGAAFRRESMRAALRFLAGFAGVGFVCLIMIVMMTHPLEPGESALGAFIDDGISQQQFKEGYGNSPLSFWGQHPGLAAWAKPLAGVLFCIFSLSLAWRPKALSDNRLFALAAALLVGVQLVLSHGGGSYIGFYLALLILALFHKTEGAQNVN